MADDLTDTRDTPSGDAPASDLSQYIRTYAKDVAALSGKGGVVAKVAKPAPTPTPRKVPPPPKRRGEISDGVEFDATEQPFFEQQAPKEEEVNYGPVEIATQAEADSIIEHRPSSVPMPATMSTPASPPNEDREAILGRLRAKMSTPAPIPEPVRESAPETSIPTPAPETVPAPPPVFKESSDSPVHALPPLYREPIPEPEARELPQSLPKPLPTTAPPAPVSDRFHSYATDFKQQVDTEDASPFTVIAAQQDAKPKNVPVAKPVRGPALAIAGASLLLVLSVSSAYAAYRYLAAHQTLPIHTTTVPTILFADEFVELTGTGAVLLQALAATATDALVEGNVLVTYVAQEATGEAGVIAGAPAPGGYLVKALQLPAPDILLRNIAEDSTVGVIHEGSETRAFFALRVTSYERTFAGMLTWEPLMSRDLALLYPLYPAEETAVTLDSASSTSATTTATQHQLPGISAASRMRFEDAIVANRDVRVLRDTLGRSLLMYGYADKETLIIARDEKAFAALLVRLAAASK